MACSTLSNSIAIVRCAMPCSYVLTAGSWSPAFAMFGRGNSPGGTGIEAIAYALAAAAAKLQHDFGRWDTPWGDINRYQRITDDIVQPFDDAKPSLPVGLAASKWGALASFDTETPRKTKKIYGSVGNSFVAAVEFGTPVRAKAGPFPFGSRTMRPAISSTRSV